MQDTCSGRENQCVKLKLSPATFPNGKLAFPRSWVIERLLVQFEGAGYTMGCYSSRSRCWSQSGETSTRSRGHFQQASSFHDSYRGGGSPPSLICEELCSVRYTISRLVVHARPTDSWKQVRSCHSSRVEPVQHMGSSYIFHLVSASARRTFDLVVLSRYIISAVDAGFTNYRTRVWRIRYINLNYSPERWNQDWS